MTRSIKLVGLDCGSTTTSAVVAAARLTTGALGRVEVTGIEQVYRSPVVFTPLLEERIDAVALARYLDEWLAAAQTMPDEIFGGGALITGLAARRENAQAVTALIEQRMAESVIATADEPWLESWLAFMGNCHALSKEHPHTSILNIDIGGGTTNLALGIDGQVLCCGCLWVGARHFRFEPGTYRLTHVSAQAQALLEHLGIAGRVGDVFAHAEIEAIVEFYVALVEAAVEGNPRPPADGVGQLHVQVPLRLPEAHGPPSAITLSGGVGELVYDRMRGLEAAGPTRFGDLGGELAARILHSPSIAGRMRSLTPEGLGRATVYGLLQHGTELSGATLYLPRPERLPLKNVPIVGRIGPQSNAEQLAESLELAAHAGPAAALRVDVPQHELEAIRGLGSRLADRLATQPAADRRALVLLVSSNSGKVLGNYITRWGTLTLDLLVVDEVPDRDAQFVRLGRLCEGVVPLWLYAVR